MSAFTSQPKQNRCVSIWLSEDFFCYSAENFLLRLLLDSFPCPLNVRHYNKIIGRLQCGAGLVCLSLSELIVND